MRLGLWLFLRIIVPTGPILIQYGLHAFGAYDPVFPQITYVVLLFGISLVTLTEYTNIVAIIYLSVIPSGIAIFLYTAILFVPSGSPTHNNMLLFGFVLWITLLFINVLRVLLDALPVPPDMQAS